MVKVMAINAGSSSLKFQLINMPSEEVITSGLVERIGLDQGNFEMKYNGEKFIKECPIKDHSVAVQLLLDALVDHHVVGHLSGDYTSFSKYFGEDRYNQNPWYGESYQDNRGHYDLITVDGIDFIMLYMGWGIGDQEIQWMNDVLAKYPERKAILNFHEYLLASGGLGEEPQRIYNEVVAVNPNVCMVLSGHYHNAQTVVSQFDDNHDGVNDRNVYQMLFDYQGLSQVESLTRSLHRSISTRI